MKAARLINLTPTIVASRDADGTVEVMEFDAPKGENDSYGYLMRYSYKLPNGTKKRGIWDKDYLCGSD